MAIRAMILGSPEIVGDLILAAEDRFRDAEELLVARRHDGAAYLLGLAAEMWLKTACFRILRVRNGAMVVNELAPIRLWMSLNAPSIPAESYHSLRFWCEHLILRRRALGIPLGGNREGELRHHVSHRLHEDWKIDLCYRSVRLTQQQAWRAYNDVCWIRETWPNLWR